MFPFKSYVKCNDSIEFFSYNNDDDDGDDGDYVYSTKPNLTPACLSLVGRALDVPALPPWVKPKQQVYPERR